ncbi:hypothetical protein Tco_0449297 [Tanacetum coccineum]
MIPVITHRWRSRVASRSSSPTTSTPKIPTAPILPATSAVVAPSSEFPLAHVDAPPGIHRRRAILIRPGEDIPISRLYHTHPCGPCRALTARKSVRPLPSHRLTLRYIPHHLDRFTSGSSLGHSSSDHSSSRHSISGHSLSGTYTTRHPGDSSSESSARPSCKRYMSPAATVTSSIHATRALVPSRADLLPPRKRFRDSISPEDSVEDIDTNVLEDMRMMYEDEVESSDRGTIEVGVDVVIGIDIPDGMLMPDARVEDIETGQRELEARSLIVGGERDSLLDQVASLERSNTRLRGTLMMESARADRFRRRMGFMESELR